MKKQTYAILNTVENEQTMQRCLSKMGKPDECITITKESDITELVDFLQSLIVKKGIEKHLDGSTYEWVKVFEFVRGEVRYVIYEEIDPSGRASELTMLYEENEGIYNAEGQMVAFNGVSLPEGYSAEEVLAAGIQFIR